MTDKCTGENCTSIDGFNHSVECLFEHFTAYTGAHREPIDVLRKIKKAYFDGYEAAAPAQPQSDGVLMPVSDVEEYISLLIDEADAHLHGRHQPEIQAHMRAEIERVRALLGGEA